MSHDGGDDDHGDALSSSSETNDQTSWNASTVTLSIFLFLITGVAEIGGGWLIWQYCRQGKPYWWGLLGCGSLIVYGFLPTLQPSNNSIVVFGRIYAVYGGFFIFLSFLWGWGLDGDRPDRGDWVGGSLALVGVLVVLFWPR